MTPAETTRLRITVLQTLRATGGIGLPETDLATAARIAGFDVVPPDIAAVLRALETEALVSRFDTLAGRRARITDLGGDRLREAGL